jgi:hypothetical protein
MTHKTGYKTAGLKQHTERNLPAIGKEAPQPQPQIIALAGYKKDPHMVRISHPELEDSSLCP